MNINQIKIILIFKANNVIYEIKKAKQVFIHEKIKKCAFTAVLSSFCKSKVLSIWNI